jgi:soluble lytic murein transglycosylase-like protein
VIRLVAAAAIVLAIILAASVPGALAGENDIYVYTDGDGVTHYSNMPSDSRYRRLTSVEPPRTTGDSRSRPYEAWIAESAAKYGVDPNLLMAVIKCESNFNRMAISRAGAQGLMQLMPDTAKLVEVEDPFDPRQNLEGGTRYLKYLLDSFDDTRLALAAYNAGEGAVRRHGGIPPYKETKNYVAAVLSQYEHYCKVGRAGAVITTEDIRSFTNSEGVRLFTNVPWKYNATKEWEQESRQ